MEEHNNNGIRDWKRPDCCAWLLERSRTFVALVADGERGRREEAREMNAARAPSVALTRRNANVFSW